MAAQREALFLGPRSRVFQFSSYSFDASLLEIITTLSAGGCVCIPSEAQRMADIAGAMSSLNINWAHLSPSLARNIQPKDVPGLKTLIFGGELLTQDVIQQWLPGRQLLNPYGPSECCVVSTVNNNVTLDTSPANIGHAICGFLWVVDRNDHDRLAQIGAIGELLIEGPALARGYLNESERSKLTFIENPKWRRPAIPGRRSRMYKTGDLVRYSSTGDGTLDFIGRKDTQVSLRGQRVELGEVEHHLKCAITNVREVAAEVIVPRDAASKPLLVAFINFDDASGNEATTPARIAWSLRGQLATLARNFYEKMARSLPFYMVPAMIIPVTSMPMTSSAKTDRLKLRQWVADMSTQELAAFADIVTNKRPPSTAMEKKLQVLWAKILAIDSSQISAQDGFINLGGDSIDAMKLVGLANEDGISLTVADVFRHPKLCELSKVASFTQGTTGVKEIDPFSLLKTSTTSSEGTLYEVATLCRITKPSLIEDIYPCTPLQEGLIALAAKRPGAYIAQHVYKLPQSMEIQRFKAAWEAIVEANSMLRTRFVQIASTEILQVVVKENLDWRLEENLEEYLAADRKSQILFGAPSTRYALITSHIGSRYFVWTAHHAVYDGWSLGLLHQQVQRAYQGISLKVTPGFNRFIEYVSKLGIDSTAAKEFWKAELLDASPITFPTLPSPTYQPLADSSTRHRISFSRPAHSSLTLSTIIQAGWGILVAAYCGTDDVVFGMTLAGRSSPVTGIESILGPTMTTVPKRMRVSQEKKTCELLEDIQDQSTETLMFEHLGLQSIKRISPEALVACNFQNLLIVQPRDHGESESGAFLHAATETSRMTENFESESTLTTTSSFNTYAMVIECAVNSGTEIEITASYDAKVVDLGQMERILRQFDHILQQLFRESTTNAIRDIEMVSPEDSLEIWNWNATVPEKVETCIHSSIELSAGQHQNAQAVCSWDGDLSYQQLNDRAQLFAYHLADRGIRPKSLVPFSFEKSQWAIIAMLGILKAGCGCVPLDLSQPIARHKKLFELLGSDLVVTTPTYKDRFDYCVQAAIVLDGTHPLWTEYRTDDLSDFTPLAQSHGTDQSTTTWAASSASPSASPGVSSPISSVPSDRGRTRAVQVSPDDIAFCVFTSGSTGEPKGILLRHSAICTSAAAHGAAMQINSQSRVFQFAAYVFDVSIGDIFTTLMRGGCVCIPSDHDRVNRLAECMNDMEVTHACLTPTVASQPQLRSARYLRYLTIGGEPMIQENIDIWSEKTYLTNIYGPAECSVWCASHSGLTKSARPSNIGHALGGVLWIVDSTNHERLMPIGAAG